MHTYHIFLSQSSVAGHLGSFHVLAIENSAAMNTGVHISFQIRVFIFFSRYIFRSGIAGSYGSFLFSFLRHSILFAIVGAPIYILTNIIPEFSFSTPSPAFIIGRLFDNSYSNWYEVISHCDFDLHFSNN